MPIETETGERIYQTGDRRVAVKEQVTNAIIDEIRRFGRIIETSTDPYNDARIDFQTQYLMTLAFDKKQTIDMLDDRDTKIKAVLDGESDTRITNKKIGRINLECIAGCSEIFDNYLGLKKKQVLLEVKDGESVKYANELNNTYIDYMMANRRDEIDTTGIKEEVAEEKNSACEA